MSQTSIRKAIDLPTFIEMVRRRHATRSFRSDPLPEGLLEQLLEAARWAPSGYNLQPIHFVVVQKSESKNELCRACLDQRQIIEAPVSVAIVGDLRAYQNHFERVLAMDLETGAIDQEYVDFMRKVVPTVFERGAFDLMRMLKTVAVPWLRLIRPVPSIPAIEPRYWLAKQASLSAMNFMSAATVAGLASCPMEGFDESRVARCLRLPDSVIPVLIIPVGYSDAKSIRKTRLPIQDLLHQERW